MVGRIFLAIICLLLTVSCDGQNFLEEYSSKDSDQALYIEAKNRMNDFDWDGAITIITEKMSPAFVERLDVKETLMHAYGGKCGISFFDFINNLKNTNSTKMFDFAMKIFAGRVVDMEACDNSLAVLHSIGDIATKRTNQQNLYAAILGLTRMATTIKAKFDTEYSGLGDGNVDAGVNACAVSAAVHRLSDAEMNRVVAGVGLIFENLTQLGDSLTSGSAGGAFDAAKTICQTEVPIPTLREPGFYNGALAGQTWAQVLNKPSGFTPTWSDFGLPSDFAEPLNCMNTKDGLVTAKMRRLFRRMIESSTLGFGSCDISNMTFNFDTNTWQASVTASCCPAPGMVVP